MGATARVTVTLPFELVEDIDRVEKNRSRFIVEAVERELEHRRREKLNQSLRSPHPEASELADAGLAHWASILPTGDDDLVDVSAGTPVRWVEGRGWVAGHT